MTGSPYHLGKRLRIGAERDVLVRGRRSRREQERGDVTHRETEHVAIQAVRIRRRDPQNLGEKLRGRLSVTRRNTDVIDMDHGTLRAHVFADAGGQYIAVQHTFTTTANSSGEVVVQFVSGVDNPIVNGIVVN